MYIENKYWNGCIGSTDDSLTLTDYFVDKQKKTSPSVIFSQIQIRTSCSGTSAKQIHIWSIKTKADG